MDKDVEKVSDTIDNLANRTINAYQSAVNMVASVVLHDKPDAHTLALFDAPLVLARTSLAERMKMYRPTGEAGNMHRIRMDVIATTWQLIQFMATLHHVLITEYKDDEYDMSPEHVKTVQTKVDEFLNDLHMMRQCGKLPSVHERVMDNMDTMLRELNNIVKASAASKKED